MFDTSNLIFNLMPTLFVWLLGIILCVIVITFIYGISQSKNAILKNYPVVAHFRYLFSTMGEFFRQYFFAMDREKIQILNRTHIRIFQINGKSTPTNELYPTCSEGEN